MTQMPITDYITGEAQGELGVLAKVLMQPDFEIIFDHALGYFITTDIMGYQYNFGKNVEGEDYVAWITQDSFYLEIARGLEPTNENLNETYLKAQTEIFYRELEG